MDDFPPSTIPSRRLQSVGQIEIPKKADCGWNDLHQSESSIQYPTLRMGRKAPGPLDFDIFRALTMEFSGVGEEKVSSISIPRVNVFAIPKLWIASARS